MAVRLSALLACISILICLGLSLWCTYAAHRIWPRGVISHKPVSACPGVLLPRARRASREAGLTQRLTPHRPPRAEFKSRVVCKCFDLCTQLGIEDFVDLLPEYVISVSSPWYAYLEAVYGQPPALPFRLLDLQYFYHNSDFWLRKHPDLSLPIPPCTMSSDLQYFNHHSGSAVAMQNCTQTYCLQWSESRGESATTSHRSVYGKYTLSWEGSYPYASTGTRFVILDKNQPQISDVPANTWFEVIRSSECSTCKEEGSNGYGFWFWRAPGSGIWINSGCTFAEWLRHDNLYESPRTLYLAWLKMFDASSKDVHNLTKGLKLEYWAECVHGGPRCGAVMYYDLGYDTVMTAGVENMRDEVYVVNELALVKPNCPYEHRLERLTKCGWGPRSSGCPGRVELRTGWNATSSCTCDTSRVGLNCDSIA